MLKNTPAAYTPQLSVVRDYLPKCHSLEDKPSHFDEGEIRETYSQPQDHGVAAGLGAQSLLPLCCCPSCFRQTTANLQLFPVFQAVLLLTPLPAQALSVERFSLLRPVLSEAAILTLFLCCFNAPLQKNGKKKKKKATLQLSSCFSHKIEVIQ